MFGDLNSWFAKIRKKEDPNAKIGATNNGGNKTFYALNDVNIEVKKGEAVGIIGLNGAGKSTLLKLISRVTAPTEGQITVVGRISSMLEVGTGFHPELTGRENVYLNGAILGMTRAEVSSKMDEIIEFSEVGKFIDTPVKRYSSGMYVKLAFSVAAHLDADILIMDEVLAVGDAKFQEKCLNKMIDLATKQGKTVLYVSHNMNTIRKLCTRVVVLERGQVKYDGELDEGIRRYLGTDSGLPTYYDFDSKPRTANWVGSFIKMTSLTLPNKETATYVTGEEIKGKIRLKASEDVKNIKVRFVIVYSDLAISGTAFSNAYESEIKKGEEVELDFNFNIDNLSYGKYSVNTVIYCNNEFNETLTYDFINSAWYFEKQLENDDSVLAEWENNNFGNIKLKDIAIKGEKI